MGVGGVGSVEFEDEAALMNLKPSPNTFTNATSATSASGTSVSNEVSNEVSNTNENINANANANANANTNGSVVGLVANGLNHRRPKRSKAAARKVRMDK